MNIPEQADRESYLEGMRDMAQYVQEIGIEIEQTVDQELSDDGDVCDECGAPLSHDPSSASSYCGECDL